MSYIKRFFIAVFSLIMFIASCSQVEAKEQIDVIQEIQGIINQKEISENDIDKLEELLSNVEVTESFYFTPEVTDVTRGYGQWHDLGKGWKARVDKPHTGAGKPHVHVEKGKVKGVESVDGSKSHGKTLGSAGVPKDIQKKARNLKDYKKGQSDLKKMKEAKSKIKAKKLNLKKTTDIIIAIAIFVSVVGLMIFSLGSIGAWGSLLLAI